MANLAAERDLVPSPRVKLPLSEGESGASWALVRLVTLGDATALASGPERVGPWQELGRSRGWAVFQRTATR